MNALQSNDPPRQQVVRQRIRNRVIEVFETFASFQDQIDYAIAVPFVHIPYEILNQWGDWVRPELLDDSDYTMAYSPQEVAQIKAFNTVVDAASSAFPDDYPTLEFAQSLPEWERLRLAAVEALAVFMMRGKMPEDVEAPL